MHHAEIHSHKDGVAVAEELGLGEVVRGVCDAPRMVIRAGATGAIRAHVRTFLSERGWPGETSIKAGYDLKIFSLRPDAAFQVQTGNAARGSTDLLKLQYLYTSERIEVALLAVPTRGAAAKLGSNRASYERLRDELTLFSRVLSTPLVLIGFE
jgi:hypothetical protein